MPILKKVEDLAQVFSLYSYILPMEKSFLLLLMMFCLAFCFVCCSSQLKIIGISGNQPSGQICSDWGSTFLQRNSNKSHFSPKPCPRWALVGARTSPVFEPKSSSSLSNYLRLFTSKVFRFHSRFLIAKVRGFVLYGASQTFRPGALSLSSGSKPIKCSERFHIRAFSLALSLF